MSTTISTQHQHHRLPLAAALSIAGVIAAGVVGVAWHESTGSGSHEQASPAQTQPRQASQENSAVAERGLAPNGHGHGHDRQYYPGELGGQRFQLRTDGGRTLVGP